MGLGSKVTAQEGAENESESDFCYGKESESQYLIHGENGGES